MPPEVPIHGYVNPAGFPDNAVAKGVAAGADGIRVGVYGSSESNTGVYGASESGIGVRAESTTSRGLHATGKPAGHFEGDVEMAGNLAITGNLTLNGSLEGSHQIQGDLVLTGDIRFTDAADCAEDFTIGTDLGVAPGTVVVLGPEGSLFPSQTAYDKRVVGVVSGAGEYSPAIILDRKQTEENRQPVALVGKVYCKVDADHAAVDVGDLLTTSPTLGHAMKATDPMRAFGSVIGKALQPLTGGRGLIPVLVALQ